MSETKSGERTEKIDITQWIDRFQQSFKRLWWLVILIVGLCITYKYKTVKDNYVSIFKAEATLTVSATQSGLEKGSDSYQNTAKAEMLQNVFESIVASGALDERIAADLDMSYVPGTYNVSAIKGTNMLTISATAGDGETAYAILQSVIKEYPEIAQVVVGQTYAVVLDDSGIPEDSGIAIQTRGSLQSGALLGIIISCLVLLFDMIVQRTIRYENDITHLLHLRCLGMLPRITHKKRTNGTRKQLSILENNVPFSYLESIRSLRSRVERNLERYGKKTFLVTSSVPSEGKSTVAANLAAAFGRKGKKVILVDCDIRHPSVQERLGIPGEYPGLQALVNGQVSVEDCLYKVEGMEVYVLCGAKEPSVNIDLLGSIEMKRLILKMESMADVVILDTSPSAILADAITLARNVPLALYIVRCGYVKVRNVFDGIDELSETGIKIMGCVLNYSDEASSKRSSGYGYGYGYGYGKHSGYGYGHSNRVNETYGEIRKRITGKNLEEELEELTEEDLLPEMPKPAPVIDEAFETINPEDPLEGITAQALEELERLENVAAASEKRVPTPEELYRYAALARLLARNSDYYSQLEESPGYVKTNPTYEQLDSEEDDTEFVIFEEEIEIPQTEYEEPESTYEPQPTEYEEAAPTYEEPAEYEEPSADFDNQNPADNSSGESVEPEEERWSIHNNPLSINFDDLDLSLKTDSDSIVPEWEDETTDEDSVQTEADRFEEQMDMNLPMLNLMNDEPAKIEDSQEVSGDIESQFSMDFLFSVQNRAEHQADTSIRTEEEISNAIESIFKGLDFGLSADED